VSGEGAVDLSLAEVTRLEEVVDRDALAQVCQSFFGLFGLSIRVFSREGTLLADAHQERAVCRYVNTLQQGRSACASTVGAVKELDPDEGTVIHPCFTGAVYRIVPVEYQGRRIGRIVIGPYLPAETKEVPQTLLQIDPELEPEKARETLDEMPRVRSDTAERIAEHMRGILDLLLFSSHRAHLTSEMHVASVRENYRELAEKNEKLQQAYDRLKELDRLKSNFLATVSHELRTPLTSIIGYSEMLESGMAGELNEEQREFVDTIRGKGDHLLQLISSLLDLSKLEQGNLSLQRETIEPRSLLDEVAKTVTPQATKKEVSIQTDVEDGIHTIEGDPVRIKQVLFNLADNAIKFTPHGGTVYLAAKGTEIEDDSSSEGDMGLVLMATPKRGIEFRVGDTGIGIPRGQLPRIFDAFYQVDGGSTREYGGTGLGLAIVRRLVEAHGGKVDVDSDEGQGTTFFVSIPETQENPNP
jgi:signal transduction histidine kinase